MTTPYISDNIQEISDDSDDKSYTLYCINPHTLVVKIYVTIVTVTPKSFFFVPKKSDKAFQTALLFVTFQVVFVVFVRFVMFERHLLTKNNFRFCPVMEVF